MKNTLLAIETATPACSAALIHQGQYYCRFQFAPKEHTHLILPMVESLVQEAGIRMSDIQAIAVGRGPGSFTGVRIAMSVAQGLAFGLDIPIYPISTLEALAYQAREHLQIGENTQVIPALDARMQEIYIGDYQYHTPQKMLIGDAGEKVGSFAQIASMVNPHAPQVITLGSGWDLLSQEAQTDLGLPYLPYHHLPNCHPHAKHIAYLALEQIQAGNKGVAAEEATPVYLRDNVAAKPKQKDTV